eukprot:scaffold664377_cov59-Prasinocladus_malaysianus.AAC.1
MALMVIIILLSVILHLQPAFFPAAAISLLFYSELKCPALKTKAHNNLHFQLDLWPHPCTDDRVAPGATADQWVLWDEAGPPHV